MLFHQLKTIAATVVVLGGLATAGVLLAEGAARAQQRTKSVRQAKPAAVDSELAELAVGKVVRAETVAKDSMILWDMPAWDAGNVDKSVSATPAGETGLWSSGRTFRRRKPTIPSTNSSSPCILEKPLPTPAPARSRRSKSPKIGGNESRGKHNRSMIPNPSELTNSSLERAGRFSISRHSCVLRPRRDARTTVYC